MGASSSLADRIIEIVHLRAIFFIYRKNFLSNKNISSKSYGNENINIAFVIYPRQSVITTKVR